jgi:hypothetical protein
MVTLLQKAKMILVRLFCRAEEGEGVPSLRAGTDASSPGADTAYLADRERERAQHERAEEMYDLTNQMPKNWSTESAYAELRPYYSMATESVVGVHARELGKTQESNF